jgi:hypothetical protein
MPVEMGQGDFFYSVYDIITAAVVNTQRCAGKAEL